MMSGELFLGTFTLELLIFSFIHGYFDQFKNHGAFEHEWTILVVYQITNDVNGALKALLIQRKAIHKVLKQTVGISFPLRFNANKKGSQNFASILRMSWV